MVKNRGIDIAIISQFGIQRLPEFEGLDQKRTNESNVAVCFVPIYPGSQIWFEYTVEPPHPTNAAYFFKLFVNNQAVIAWDCTEKYGYHGKMIYVLEKIESQRPYPGMYLQRKGFRFLNTEDASELNSAANGDLMEIRVYRIEHRQRIRNHMSSCDGEKVGTFGNHIQLINGGFLEPGRPQRRYKYQLLDPADKPYAIFRFYCRTYDYLKENHIILTPEESRLSSLSASTIWHVRSFTATTDPDNANDSPEGREAHIYPDLGADMSHSTPPKVARTNTIYTRKSSPVRSQRHVDDAYLPLSDSDESLSAVARDSIEDIPSTVPRSPESLRSRQHNSTKMVRVDIPPTRNPCSPRQKLKKHLKIDLAKAKSSTESKRRPLSPFTSGGFLRRLASPIQPTPAPAAISQPQYETVQEQVPQSFGIISKGSEQDKQQQTSILGQPESSGSSIMRFLSRRGSRRKRFGGTNER